MIHVHSGTVPDHAEYMNSKQPSNIPATLSGGAISFLVWGILRRSQFGLKVIDGPNTSRIAVQHFENDRNVNNTHADIAYLPVSRTQFFLLK